MHDEPDPKDETPDELPEVDRDDAADEATEAEAEADGAAGPEGDEELERIFAPAAVNAGPMIPVAWAVRPYRRSHEALHWVTRPAPDAWGLSPTERLGLGGNDEDLAARLFSDLGDRLIFVEGAGWHVYEGGRWRRDASGNAAKREARILRELVRQESTVAGSVAIPDTVIADHLRKEQAKGRPRFGTHEEAERDLRSLYREQRRQLSDECGMNAVKVSALEALKDRVTRDRDQLDADPLQLVVENGILDLRAVLDFDPPEPGAFTDDDEREAHMVAVRRTWLRRHHDVAASFPSRPFYPTKRASVRFDPAAKCPKCEAFLKLIFPDEAIREYALGLFALMLLGENKHQIVVILQGEGANGKSTLMKALRVVFGEYVHSVNISFFLVDRNERADGANPSEVGLDGSRLIVASEPDQSDTLCGKKLKGLTGGDARTARPMYAPESFTYTRYRNLTSGNSAFAGAARLCRGMPRQRRPILISHGVAKPAMEKRE